MCKAGIFNVDEEEKEEIDNVKSHLIAGTHGPQRDAATFKEI